MTKLLLNECIANIRWEGSCTHTACIQTQPQSSSEPKVICYNCKEEFSTRKEMIDHKRDSDTDHPSKKKRNQTDCQKSKCLYVHKTLMRTKNDVINQRDIPTFICKTCQNNFIDKNELMHHRKHEHSINILCKYFLTSTCIRSSNQGALCWFRHDQLPLSGP